MKIFNFSRVIQHGNAYRLQPPRRVPALPEPWSIKSLCTAVSSNIQCRVLGIETSCDDTGAAIVDSDGNILGEALNSQTAIHVEMGGIIPPVARDLHKKHIQNVVDSALKRAGMSVEDVDAIATTVKPGLALSLYVGLEYSKRIVKQFKKPFIPIHHMEAHALTARLTNRVEFPFLVLLISGGHSLLAVVRGVDDFLLLGKGLDDAPGEAFDKVARRLKLKNLPLCSGLSGGRAIELVARDGNLHAYDCISVMSQLADCNFSFAGIKAWALRTVGKDEEKYGIQGGDVLPNVADFCASLQYMVLHHLAKRVQRAFLYCELKQLIPSDSPRTLVVSGGVASNEFIRSGLERMCRHYSYNLVCPPPRLCTDNGVMIAWNGVERYRLGLGIEEDYESIDIETRCPLGVDVTEDVQRCHIKLERVKIV